MSGFVLDCSVAASWLFDDEATPETDALLDQLKEEGAVVPGIWHLEIGNVLVRAERRKRISTARVATYLQLLRRLAIVTDTETDERALRETLMLAREWRLSTYDAAYLELAMRRGKPLATLDRARVRAARYAAVEILPRNACTVHERFE